MEKILINLFLGSFVSIVIAAIWTKPIVVRTAAISLVVTVLIALMMGMIC